MVNFIDCGREEFLSYTKGKRIYCFGAGKYLTDFIDENYGISIEGIIDNYQCADGSSVTINGIAIDLISIDMFLKLYDSTCVVVITSSFFMEILEQLDSIERLEGMECYVELFIRHYTDDMPNLELHKTQIRKRNYGPFFLESISEKIPNDTKKYQIWECLGEFQVAGGKAPRDVKNILESKGYTVIPIHPYRENEGESDNSWSYHRLMEEWKKGYDLMVPNSLLFLQYPFCQKQLLRNRRLRQLKTEKNVRIITLIHDMELLRKIYLNIFLKEDFEFIVENSDILIIHNNSMKKYFVKEVGVSRKKLISLEIFDYLYQGTGSLKQFEKSIVIAGNMDRQKSPYIEKLGKLYPLKIHLYGPNYADKTDEHDDRGEVIYHGSFPSNEIPQILDRGFGLVWDGDSLDTCSGATGEYLRYNNPHKLSLYLAAGLPVIIWKEAAESVFVEKHGVGFTVKSLYEIQGILENVTKEQYTHFLSQVQKISAKLVQGEYTRLAVERAENMIKTGTFE